MVTETSVEYTIDARTLRANDDDSTVRQLARFREVNLNSQLAVRQLILTSCMLKSMFTFHLQREKTVVQNMLAEAFDAVCF